MPGIELDELVRRVHVHLGLLRGRSAQGGIPVAPHEGGGHRDDAVPSILPGHTVLAQHCAVPVDGPAQVVRGGEATPVAFRGLPGDARTAGEGSHAPGEQTLRCGGDLEHADVPGFLELVRGLERVPERGGVRGGQHGQRGHPLRCAQGDVPGEHPAPVVAHQVEPLRSGLVREGQRVPGELLAAVRGQLGGSGAWGVPTLVHGESAQPLRIQLFGDVVPAAGILRETVQQQDHGAVLRALVENVERESLSCEAGDPSHASTLWRTEGLVSRGPGPGVGLRRSGSRRTR